MKIKLLGQIFLIFFGILGILILLIWIRFIFNSQTEGLEMADSAFLLIFTPATIYFSGVTLWTYKLYKQHQRFNASVVIQYLLIFIFGICTAIWGLIKIV